MSEQNYFNAGPADPLSPDFEIHLAKTSTAPSRPKIVAAKPAPEAPPDGPEGQLTIDVYQTANEIVIESAVAGIRLEDLDIHVTNDSVSIRGHRSREQRVREEDYLYQECYWGRFSRSVILPQEVDPENAKASFKNGILTVRLPKLIRQTAKKLKVITE